MPRHSESALLGSGPHPRSSRARPLLSAAALRAAPASHLALHEPVVLAAVGPAAPAAAVSTSSSATPHPPAGSATPCLAGHPGQVVSLRIFRAVAVAAAAAASAAAAAARRRSQNAPRPQPLPRRSQHGVQALLGVTRRRGRRDGRLRRGSGSVKLGTSGG